MAAIDVCKCNDVAAVVVKNLRTLAAGPSPVRPPTSPGCETCGYPEAACRNLAAKTNDPHPFTATVATLAPVPTTMTTTTPSADVAAKTDRRRERRTNDNGGPQPVANVSVDDDWFDALEGQ